MKLLNGYVVELPLYVTFTCSVWHLNGVLIAVGKKFGSQDCLLEDKMDHSLITKNTWKSYKYMWDP